MLYITPTKKKRENISKKEKEMKERLYWTRKSHSHIKETSYLYQEKYRRPEEMIYTHVSASNFGFNPSYKVIHSSLLSKNLH